MIGLDAATLASAMAGCPMQRAQVWAPFLDEAMGLADINSPQRAADFIAQIGHESLGLLYANEIWGPTDAQKTYERDFSQLWGPTLRRGDRNFKAWNLGNAQPGDGRKFAGHGPIQTTGRTNHALVRDELRVLLGTVVPNFEEDPQAMGQPRWGALSAAMFWKRKGLNGYADRGDFIGQTERINGGRNGLDDRLARRVRARKALGYT
ncbi:MULTISPECIES: glycoside hydrolase family 19 protein [unclassified Variovorax]|uniref:glycoside hydrolase family 19 protein n=1 Tax=unclassified Variovorax TaxID=663243 RepID=UPI003F4793FC